MSHQIGAGVSSSATLNAEFTLGKDDKRHEFVDAFLAQARAKIMLELASANMKDVDVDAGLILAMTCEIRSEQTIDVNLDNGDGNK